MSNPQSHQPRPDLPPAAIDRLFARLLAIFGAQRIAGAWGNVDPVERNAVWSQAIGRAVWSPLGGGRYDLQAVADALDELAGEPTSWPPTCGEFADRCERHAQRPGRRLALPVPNRTAEDIERGREQMARIKAMLGRAMKRPASTDTEPREPGSDDEPLPPRATPACTCWTGSVRKPELCDACAGFRAQVQRRDEMKAA
jgi:hypothetical protein